MAETEAVIAARSVDLDRWAVPDKGQAAALRASAAADELSFAASVVDLGAGAMLLRERLDPGCRYLPVDLFRFAADMVLMDVERAPLATLGRCDAAAARPWSSISTTRSACCRRWASSWGSSC